jgi:hypothetical protein
MISANFWPKIGIFHCPDVETKFFHGTGKVRPKLGRLVPETFFPHYSNELA